MILQNAEGLKKADLNLKTRYSPKQCHYGRNWKLLQTLFNHNNVPCGQP